MRFTGSNQATFKIVFASSTGRAAGNRAGSNAGLHGEVSGIAGSAADQLHPHLAPARPVELAKTILNVA